MKLRIVSDGKLNGWVWLALFGAVYLATIIGVLVSDAVANRVAKCAVVVTVGLPTVLGSYAYTKKDSITARAMSALPGACKPEEKEEP